MVMEHALPNYAREYEHEWQRYDRFLRLRWSLDYPGRFVLERRTRYLDDYPFVYGTDRQIRLRDGYRLVTMLRDRDFPFVRIWLREHDIQRTGARALSQQLERAELLAEESAERARLTELDAAGGEAYDFLAWREGSRVSMSGVKRA